MLFVGTVGSLPARTFDLWSGRKSLLTIQLNDFTRMRAEAPSTHNAGELENGIFILKHIKCFPPVLGRKNKKTQQ